MINPIDEATINAMVAYREQQVLRDRYEHDVIEVVTETSSQRSTGMPSALRRSIGIGIMRLGARLAGVGMQTRIGIQS
jgi:hypothetical protein